MRKFFLFFIICNLVMISSCSSSPSRTIYESEYFQYKILDLDGDSIKEVLIMGLTEEGKQQETIVIPTVIDRYKVVSLGHSNGFNGEEGIFESPILKKIYITNQISNIGNSRFLEELSLDIIYTGNYSQKIGHSWLNIVLCAKELYLSGDFLNYNNQYFINYKSLDKCNKANVLYDLNYGENNIFMVDDCDGTIVNVLPPDPIREGYDFIGWYKEPECINKWNFENDIIPAKEYNENEEYILKETILYAKWEEQYCINKLKKFFC